LRLLLCLLRLNRLRLGKEKLVAHEDNHRRGDEPHEAGGILLLRIVGRRRLWHGFRSFFQAPDHSLRRGKGGSGIFSSCPGSSREERRSGG